jgi:hypothetical protein
MELEFLVIIIKVIKDRALLRGFSEPRIASPLIRIFHIFLSSSIRAFGGGGSVRGL